MTHATTRHASYRRSAWALIPAQQLDRATPVVVDALGEGETLSGQIDRRLQHAVETLAAEAFQQLTPALDSPGHGHRIAPLVTAVERSASPRVDSGVLMAMESRWGPTTPARISPGVWSSPPE